MDRKLCLLLATLCLAVAVVKSETYIEVDENGDEYEVKQFNIQGRQLNEGRSQCVVTRRKRASGSMKAEADVKESAAQNDDQQLYNGGNALLFYSPPVDEYDESDAIENSEEQQQQNLSNKKKPDESTDIYTAYGELDNPEDDKDEEDENEVPESFEVVQVPLIGHLHGQSKPGPVAVSPIQLKPDPLANNNGITLVQSHEPPQVNPQTHAVFELVPVNPPSPQGIFIDHSGQVVQITGSGFNAYGGDDDDDDLEYNEELNPVTTTAIWSTGDDDNNYDFVLPPQAVKKPVKTQVSGSGNKNKGTKKKTNKSPKPKPNRVVKPYKTNNRRPLVNKNNNVKRRPVNNRRPVNKRRPVAKRRPAIRKQPVRKTVRRPVSKRRNPLRRTATNKPKTSPVKRVNSDRILPTTPMNDEEDADDQALGNKNKQSNSNKKKTSGKRRRNRKKPNVVNQDANTYTRTVTMTQTGDSNDRPASINCIYINKDPFSTTTTTTTTPRPFWNILGRNANGEPRSSGHYGKRKRINMRIVS